MLSRFKRRAENNENVEKRNAIIDDLCEMLEGVSCFSSVVRNIGGEGLGYLPDGRDSRDYKAKDILGDSVYTKNPKSIDYSDEMTPVKDQGDLGSCVAFATCAVREWQEEKEYLEEKEQGSNYEREESEYDLSELELYKECKEIDDYPDEDGTTIRVSMKIMQKKGVALEKALPYNDEMEGEQEPWSKMTQKWRKIDSYYRVDGVDQARSVLADGGPFVSGIYCFSGIINPQNGMVPMPPSNEYPTGAHAIAICGYDDEKEVFKFKNSWSKKWGDFGYGYIYYDYFDKYSLDNWFPVDARIKKVF